MPANAAFAVGKDRCGSSNQADTIEHAKREALDRCSDSDCIIVYLITVADDASVATSAKSTITTTSSLGTVVPEQLNVHSAPNAEANTIIGKLGRGQSVNITGPAEGGYIAIEGTCIDGKSCKGYINGRSEFIFRQDNAAK